jgi:DMSO/TMAO reductase YedYZ molybdopterin-dependent catalytic subunit
MSGLFSRGFSRRPKDPAVAERLPPGQHLVGGFPVLSAGPTPRVDLAQWDFTIQGAVDQARRWTWEELQALPREQPTVDIHCVTHWSKLDTAWEGVSIDTLLDGVQTSARYAVAHCDGGYTTNLPMADLRDGKAWLVWSYDGRPLPPEHGGPVRLLVPHLYFWKSAKWVRSLTLLDHDELGFWEVRGYHNYGDPWREQRYS